MSEGKKYRIAIAGFMHESNTFNPLYTDRDAFVAQGLSFGASLLTEWCDAHHEVGGFLEAVAEQGNEPVPIVMAWATPAGPVRDDVFEEITGHVIDKLKAEKPDGLLLALHGAMVTESQLDADGETVLRLRSALGPDFPIVVTLDYHGNVSGRLVDHAHAVVGYQTYPHVDQRDCGKKAAEILHRLLRGEIQPRMALDKPPLIVNIMAQGTATEPMQSFMAQARQMEKETGILKISLMAGFPYADVPQMGPSVIVVTDGNEQLAYEKAKQLGEELWAAREAMAKPLPEAREAVKQALEADKLPVVLVDTGDNVGGGSAGDGTVILSEILEQGATDSVVCLYAPEEVQQCIAAGVGQEVWLSVGGKVDRLHGDAVEITGRVKLIHDGVYVEHEVRHGGKRLNNMGVTAVVKLKGHNILVLNSLRHPPFSLGQLTCLGIQPERMRLLVVKAAIAYRAAYAPIAGTIIEVDTPGLTAVNPRRFDYQHIRRPLYPLQ